MNRRAPSASGQPIGPTLAACAAVLAVFSAMAHGLTGGFEHWTFESLRVARSAHAQVTVPTMPMRASTDEIVRLWRPGKTLPKAWPSAPVYVVDFIYTTCPTVCLALGSEYQRMQSELHRQPDANVRLLSISVDPARDSPQALASYGRRFGADQGVWTLATPTDELALKALLRQLGVVVLPDGLDGFVHNASLHLIDATGRLHAIYDTTNWQGALDHARRLAQGMQP